MLGARGGGGGGGSRVVVVVVEDYGDWARREGEGGRAEGARAVDVRGVSLILLAILTGVHNLLAQHLHGGTDGRVVGVAEVILI
jgi:hypothetical protein